MAGTYYDLVRQLYQQAPLQEPWVRWEDLQRQYVEAVGDLPPPQLPYAGGAQLNSSDAGVFDPLEEDPAYNMQYRYRAQPHTVESSQFGQSDTRNRAYTGGYGQQRVVPPSRPNGYVQGGYLALLEALLGLTAQRTLDVLSGQAQAAPNLFEGTDAHRRSNRTTPAGGVTPWPSGWAQAALAP
jgi:hypothetical protein